MSTEGENMGSLAEFARASGVPISGGYFSFPAGISRVKVDVGLSWDAVQTIRWLRDDPQLAVVGVEPIPSNVASVRSIIESSEDFRNRFLLLPVALADTPGLRKLFVTKGDKGSSSLFIPLQHEWEEEITVPAFTLRQVQELIDPIRFPRIDYLKTDCQGSDLDIVRGAGDAIARFAIVTVEAENVAYEGTSNSELDIEVFFEKAGFTRINPRSQARRLIGKVLQPFTIVHRVYDWLKRSRAVSAVTTPQIEVEDPTFVNEKYAAELANGEITAYQRG
jgi:FkbM family methyltransferase